MFNSFLTFCYLLKLNTNTISNCYHLCLINYNFANYVLYNSLVLSIFYLENISNLQKVGKLCCPIFNINGGSNNYIIRNDKVDAKITCYTVLYSWQFINT